MEPGKKTIREATGASAAFKKACRVLLLEEVGELGEFEEFLTRYSMPLRSAKSAISGKAVHFMEPYCENGKFVLLDEIGAIKPKPFSINEIKDLDSLFSAAGERFWFAGNKVMGKSVNVAESDNCTDAVEVFQSNRIWNCKYVAYCETIKESEYMFGSTHGDYNNFCINSSWISKAIRCFETGRTIKTSDAYYSFNCNGCRDVFFCYNQHSKTHCVGNLQLQADKFLELKRKLLSEIAGMLKSRKTAPSLVDVCSGKW